MPYRISTEADEDSRRKAATLNGGTRSRFPRGGSRSRPSFLPNGGGTKNKPALSLRQSNATDEVCHRYFQSFGDSEKSIQRYIFLPAFNFSHVFVTQVSFFRQLFLAQAGLLAVIADGLANRSTIGVRHNPYESKKRRFEKPDICAILSLPPFGGWNTTVLESDAETEITGKRFLKEPPSFQRISMGRCADLPVQFVTATRFFAETRM